MSSFKDRVLLTTQRNYLFTRLQEWGFSPYDFELSEYSKSHEAQLCHRSSDYYFVIEVSHRGDYSASFSPGEKILKEVRPSLNWIGVEHNFTKWMDNLKEEIEAPDLWATVSSDTQLIRLAAHQDNQPFTPEEQLQVKKAIAEIKTYLIQSQRLTDEQTKTIEARFDYMEEAATRLGRKDWTGIFVSGLIGIVTTLSLSSDSGKDLFRFAGQIVKQFLGTVLYLAGPH